MGKVVTRRVLTVGFETMLVPQGMSDQKVAKAQSILREMRPYDHEGRRGDRERLRLNYEYVSVLSLQGGEKEGPSKDAKNEAAGNEE